jgi:hypothetical protein
MYITAYAYETYVYESAWTTWLDSVFFLELLLVPEVPGDGATQCVPAQNMNCIRVC